MTQLTARGKLVLAAALAKAPQFDQFSSEVFYNDLQELATEGEVEGFRTITLDCLRKLQATAKPAMNQLIEEIVRKRRSIPPYKSTARFSVDTLESIIRWYERKAAHRTLLIHYAKDVDFISKEQFHDYIKYEIITILPVEFTKNNFFVELFCIICCEGVFASLRTSEGVEEKAKIQHILATTMMDEIDEGVHQAHPDATQPLLLNWFGTENHTRIWMEFKEISEKTNPNFIILENLRKYNEALSHRFVDGFWQNAHLFPVERENAAKETAIDIRGFIKFQRLIFNVTTANRWNQGQPKAEYMHILQLIFRSLCPPNENFWNSAHFEQIIHSLLEAIGRVDMDFVKELSFSGLYQQMLDFIQPSDPTRITFADFMNLDKYLSSGKTSQAALCLGCLIDGKKYLEYDSREGQ